MSAFVDGAPVELDRAVERAAEILGNARFPLIAGLGTDVAGARAAIRLAERLHGAVDHLASEPFFHAARVMQDFGIMFTTPGETRRRCDLLVLLRGGSGALDHLSATRRPELIRLDPHPGPHRARDSFAPRDPEALVAELAARLRGKPIRTERTGLDDLLGRLQRARFVVFACDPDLMDALAFETLCGLVKRLNDTTRCSLLRVATNSRDNVDGVNEVALWLTGGPLRIGFGRGRAEHDPWRYDGTRLVESGEADAVLWISTLSSSAPPWRRSPPLIAMTAGQEIPGATVRFDAGRPGVDHPGVLSSGEAGALAFSEAASETGRPAVATLIERIEARLPAC